VKDYTHDFKKDSECFIEFFQLIFGRHLKCVLIVQLALFRKLHSKKCWVVLT